MRSSNLNPLGLLAALLIGSLLAGPAASAQNHVIAIGKVRINGTTVNSATTLGADATVTTQRNGVNSGSYTITVTSSRGFTGASETDFLVELTMEYETLLGFRDAVAKAHIISVNSNQLLVAVQVDDVEDSGNRSAGKARDLPFFFTIYRVPDSFPAPGTTKYLMAVGQVNALGGTTSGVGVDGIIVGSSRSDTGDYDITLTKTGAFGGATANDFVVILTVRASNREDRGIRGRVTVNSADLVTIDVRIDQLQDEANDDDPVPVNDEFYFTIYKIPPGPGIGLADSMLLVAMGRVPSGGMVALPGPLTSGGAFDGSTINRTRDGTGAYRVTITSPGAFAGKLFTDYAVQLCLDQTGVNDDAITGYISVVNDNTLEINVFTNDVEQSGESDGSPENRAFFFLLYETRASYRPDLRIGRKKSLTQQVGDDIYNAGAAGQKRTVGLRRTREKKYWFTLENDGNILDDIFLKARRPGGRITTTYFRLTGGRRNVTAAITSGGFVVDDVRPSKIIRYEARASYRKPGRRPPTTLRYLARSEFRASRLDANKAQLVPK